jgi:hypothetical protein
VAEGETDWEPLTLLVPVQPPEAVQLVAFDADQLSVVDCPAVIDVDVAARLNVGAEVARIAVYV